MNILTHIKWSEQNELPFDPSDMEKCDYVSGIGPGEFKLTGEKDLHTFKAKIMGANYSYDLLCSDGSKWEVKKPNSGVIRIAGESFKATRKYIRLFDEIAHQIQEFISCLSKDMIDCLIFVINFDIEKLKQLLQKYNNGSDKLTYSKSIFLSLKEAVSVCSNIFKYYIPKSIFIEKLGKNVDYRKLLSLLDSSNEKYDITYALSKLKHEYFLDVNLMDYDWNNICDINDFFPYDISGVILVDKKGYIVVPKSFFSKCFSIYGISRGFVRLKYSNKKNYININLRKSCYEE